MAFDLDLFVIGGGSGGVRAARMAAATGARVALAEQSRMGGTCVIRGCVPKKLMVFASAFREMPAEARAYGWDIPDGRFDWPAFRTRLAAELDRLEAVYRRLLDQAGVQVHDSRATLEDAHTIRLATGERQTAAHILVATGGRPVRPDLPHAALGLVSDDIFTLDRLPGSILIVGGGFIACEMAAILSGLGVAVTQIHRGPQILRGFDDEARDLIAASLRAQGVTLSCATDLVALDPAGTTQAAATPAPLRATTTAAGIGGVFDAVLFATGREPNTLGLGLEALGVGLGPRGEVKVDAYSQTAVPSVFAVGDATDRVNLTPVAIREAMAFVDTVFRGNPTPMDHSLVPAAVFTRPELGAIGLTETEARARGPVEVYATAFRPMRGAFAGAPGQVMMKLVVSRATRRILGCHIVAPEAAEMIQLAAIAIGMGATKEDFDRTVAVHPTMAEELVTMRTPVRTS